MADGRTDGRADGRTDGRTGRRTDGRTDGRSLVGCSEAHRSAAPNTEAHRKAARCSFVVQSVEGVLSKTGWKQDTWIVAMTIIHSCVMATVHALVLAIVYVSCLTQLSFARGARMLAMRGPSNNQTVFNEFVSN